MALINRQDGYQKEINPAIISLLDVGVDLLNLDYRLDLKLLASHARKVEYKPSRLHALVMRIRDPRSTFLIFASGKLAITGAKSEALARLAARKHAVQGLQSSKLCGQCCSWVLSKT
ncbi:hypothetical protein QBC44DRAFT_372999 [Cladorrhinum sp. PSN332]|nr:hypothetical protein QBC44DRAFT_372999 [Cladorrhinum sp. PSN332]